VTTVIIYIILYFLGCVHPIHVSVTEIQYNSKTKKTEVALKVFSDDMELAIEQMQGKKVNLSNVANDLQLQNLIETYSSKHFAIIDSKSQKVALCYIGMETDHESLWIYAETLKPVRSISFTVFNNFFSELYDDQSNLTHFKYDGNKKSAFLQGQSYSHIFDWEKK
jgi:hypothetical protein